MENIKEVKNDIERKELIPDWQDSCYMKWAKNFCYRNQWRVSHYVGDYEDCMAECALAYAECRKRYGHTVNSQKQFMYMYKLWVTAVFDTYSVKDSRARQLRESLPQDELTIDSDATLAVKLNEASSELKSIMGIFMDAPKEMMDVLRQEASGCHPKQFFKLVMKAAGIQPAKTSSLMKELQKLLT